MHPSRNSSYFSLALRALVGSSLLLVVAPCVVPTGIGTCEGCIGSDAFTAIPAGFTFAAAIEALLKVPNGLVGAEASVQGHWTANTMITIYGVAAAYHPTALDVFGRKHESEQRRRCTSAVTEEEFQENRKVALAYGILWGMASGVSYKNPIGGAEVEMRKLAEQWSIDYDICDRVEIDCTDISKPWGLASKLVEEQNSFGLRDGWNKDGSMSRVNNKVPYSDWRRKEYKPKNSPHFYFWRSRWTPLLDHDGSGRMKFQEHVTPHIGETAASFFLGDQDICDRVDALEDPDYDLHEEALLTIKRTKDLTEAQKAEVEFFDSKFTSLLPLQVQQYAEMKVLPDSFEFIQADAALIYSLLEATITVWRAKVTFDKVRPTTYINSEFKNTEIYSYGGPDMKKPMNLIGQEWQPYKQIMPHSEFPSGSACLCRAFADTMKELTGSYEVRPIINQPLTMTIPAGSSRVEAGRPLQDIVLSYDSWEDVVDRCRFTRLEGGMHFTASINGGQELCRGIGTAVADAFKTLAAGEAPQYVVDFSAPPVNEERDCASRERKQYYWK